MAAPVVIVGGGPAGLAVARAFRDHGGTRPVVLLCAEARPPYRRPPLTKEFLRGRTTVEELPIERDAWYASRAIDVRLAAPVVAVDAAARVVVTERGEELAYGDCVLCTGSEPVRPPIEGAGSPRVHVLRTVDDSARMATAAPPGARVMVVGSGFIGCEAAVSLALRGASVTMVTPERVPQAERLGSDVGGRIAAWLGEAGVSLVAGRSLDGLTEAGRGLEATLDDGTVVAVERVLMATGARPRIELAHAAGARVERGAVATDASLRTGVEGLWCAGDIAFALNASAGRRLRVEHWGEALRQGAIAGRTLAGDDAVWDDVPGFWSTIGHRTLKQAAWGDGWDEVTVDSDARGFTAWYGRRGRVVGVLTHGRDGDYERGAGLVRDGAPWPPPAS
jgi:3-phenylpropionate/trans-cinnamate dioxygenase ferredoxin reductase subunit